MKYLDNNAVTVDCILTKLGREKLSEGLGEFQIVKFACGDDEVDYRLWDTANSNGTAYYGQAIENMPVVEANPNETKTMRHKLITLSKNSQRLPAITLDGGITSFTIESNLTSPLVLKPVTYNPSGGNAGLGYTATITNGAVLKIEGKSGPGATIGGNAGGGTNLAQSKGIQTNTDNKTVTATGMEFNILPVAQYNENKTAQIMITGNETGGFIMVTITVNKQTVNVPTV